jgi:hypothetical protein
MCVGPDIIALVDELLQLRALTVELPTGAGWVTPVNDVSLGIAPGESLALVGESGSGACDTPPRQGVIFFRLALRTILGTASPYPMV